MTHKNHFSSTNEEWIGALANFSIQYNLGVIAPALLLLDPSRAFLHEDVDDPTSSNDDNTERTTNKSYFSAYPRSDEADSLLKSSVFVGAIVGQCVMGLVGDLLGSLDIAMILTNALTVVGVIGCSIAPLWRGFDSNSDSDSVYITLAVARFILGIGVGGKYPLASAMNAAAADELQLHNNCDTSASITRRTEQHRANEVARAFFWQTPGAMFPYIISALLLGLMGEPTHDNVETIHIQYLILVGIGIFPSLLVLVTLFRSVWQKSHKHRPSLTSRGPRTEACVEERRTRMLPTILTTTMNAIVRFGTRLCNMKSLFSQRHKGYRRIDATLEQAQPPPQTTATNPVLVALRLTSCWKKLAGTGLTWGLYDFIYYGTAFNLPELFSRVLGSSSDNTTHDLVTDAWHNALIASMGLPGVILAIRMMEPMGGPPNLQLWGFVAIGMACAGMILCAPPEEGQEEVEDANKHTRTIQVWLGLVSCSFLIFTLNWGCNVSSFVLPSEVFPPAVRSTFHGWSAGMGKCGAALGSYFFTKLNAKSVVWTFQICSGCCLLGVLITYYFLIRVDDNESLQQRQQQQQHHVRSLSMTSVSSKSQNTDMAEDVDKLC